MENKNYVTVKEAIAILGTTRQSVHYLKKHGILKDIIQVHKTCFLYSEQELLELKKTKSEML